MKNDIEIRSMELLCDMQGELVRALNSLAGKESNGLLEKFLLYSAKYINRAADGYTVLRKASRIDASKLLIRPAIEAMIRAVAVQKQPDLLYTIAYDEQTKHRKMARPIAVNAGMDYDTEDEKAWSVFRRECVAQFPKHKLVEKELQLTTVADIVGIRPYYDRAYRLYCSFVHATFKAMMGDAHTDSIDNWTMATCALSGLEFVVSAGGEAPKLISLRARLSALQSELHAPGTAKAADS